jgi:alanine-synthesizing transaminase
MKDWLKRWQEVLAPEDSFDGIDLSASNPTLCEFAYLHQIHGMQAYPTLNYTPDPIGPMALRQKIIHTFSDLYKSNLPTDLILTCNTSESYSALFHVFAKPGEALLCPKPGYPLLDDIAKLHYLQTYHYPCVRNATTHNWEIDLAGLAQAQRESGAKIMTLVSPHNPLGFSLQAPQAAQLQTWAQKHLDVIIIDEVFAGYEASPGLINWQDWKIPVVRLNGLSKWAGLPHIKCGWMVLDGCQKNRPQLQQILSFVTDTYLNASPLVWQWVHHHIDDLTLCFKEIQKRVTDNRAMLIPWANQHNWNVLSAPGGWNMVLKMPYHLKDWWFIELEEKHDLRVMPGEFFGLEDPETLVVSLILPEKTLRTGLETLHQFLRHS